MSTSRKSPRRPSLVNRLKRFIKQRPKLFIAVVVLMVALIASTITIAVTIFNKPEPSPKPAPVVEEKPEPAPEYNAPLTGQLVKTEKDTTKPVTAVMIENSPESRPQSGLGGAEVVYEAIAEGGITRFLALYQQEQPKLVGPVRSLRMYYVDWLAPYDASVMHVGGSSEALKEIRNGTYRDLDQFFNSATYWRSSDRYAPHNVYTNFKRINKLNQERGYKSSKPIAFKRTDSQASKEPTATSISINISSPTYNSQYSYDKKSNLYLRSQAGAPHTDTVSGRIKARVVVAMKTDMESVMEDGLRQDYRTTGSGQAWVFQDGNVYPVKWHKKNRKSQLQFTDKNGKEFELARGTTWITVLPQDRTVTWQ